MGRPWSLVSLPILHSFVSRDSKGVRWRGPFRVLGIYVVLLCSAACGDDVRPLDGRDGAVPFDAATPDGGPRTDGAPPTDAASPPTSCRGFLPAAGPWTLPYNLAAVGRNQLSTASHVLLDIDGDGRVEFVVLEDDERDGGDALTGRRHWLVFDNTGTGFAMEPTPWTLPYNLAAVGRNQLSTASHVLLDIDGDGRVEFVVLEDDERDGGDALAGRRHWLVFDNTGTGFANTPTPWTLPYNLAAVGRNQLSTASHVLLDIDGDGRVEFVVLEDDERDGGDALAGRRHWLVFDNTGTGFANTPTPWTLPYNLAAVGRNQLSTASHVLLDLDGDGRVEFVVLEDDERDGGDALTGRRHWLVFDNTGAGFANAPSPWMLPYNLAAVSRNQLATMSHVVLDLDGDGLQEFVVLEDDERDGGDALTGRRHWLVFDNTRAGFASTPSSWTLPYNLAAVGRNQLSTESHALLDLDGDGRVEFVVLEDDERDSGDALAGRRHWLVFGEDCDG